MLRLEGASWSDSSTSRSCLRSRSRPGARRVSPAPDAVPVDRRVAIGLVGPVMVRPVAGVWSSVDSRPVPPARFFDAAFVVTFLAGFLAAARVPGPLPLVRLAVDFFGRLALTAAERRFEAVAFLAFEAFFVFALRAGFLAILRLRSNVRPDLTVRP